MNRLFALAFAALSATATAAIAEEPVTYAFDGSFDDATFALENAIIGQGLVIDFTSHVGEMLNRTGADVGSAETIFDQAEIYLFCSAVTSREVMEADPMNIQHCPYGIFVTEAQGEVMIGHRAYPDDTMSPVRSLLTGIVEEAGGTR
ncbi:DUF302 domain-containing protein [Anianabacter salinae]|uniref:DUF302 domain-containing protein n=1 Tax=Anianabacter salinae TaxID=2851023 RepID=UPI00225E1254|nr:DUF302 domain-containing protein [Anianabacter salinae]MBV0912780.1 DUF302 domain-containing protein [Anianabacter salinae]